MYHLVHLIELLTKDHLEEEVTVADRMVEVMVEAAFLIDWGNPAVTVKAAQADTLVNLPWLPLHGVKSR